MAGTITTGKIISDLNNGRAVAFGDVMAVTGNVIVFVGGIGLLATGAAIGSPVAIWVAGIGFVVAAMGAVANNLEDIKQWLSDKEHQIQEVLDQLNEKAGQAEELNKGQDNKGDRKEPAITPDDI